VQNFRIPLLPSSLDDAAASQRCVGRRPDRPPRVRDEHLRPVRQLGLGPSSSRLRRRSAASAPPVAISKIANPPGLGSLQARPRDATRV